MKVEFSLIISQLISLEEREQFMTVKVWLRFELFFRKFSIFFFCFGFLYKIFKSQKLPQIWLDERLTWDPADFGKIKKMSLEYMCFCRKYYEQ